jgi:hypothetical protein
LLMLVKYSVSPAKWSTSSLIRSRKWDSVTLDFWTRVSLRVTYNQEFKYLVCQIDWKRLRMVFYQKNYQLLQTKASALHDCFCRTLLHLSKHRMNK